MSFPAGTTIVEEGLLGETMFVVTSGEAKVVRGKRRLGTVRPGDFFGEVALLDGAPRSASVVAETPIVAIRLFRRTLLKMLEAEPQLSLKILDSLVRRVRALRDDLAQRLAGQQPFDLGAASPSSSSTSPAAALSRVCVRVPAAGDRRR